jgi:hypothetical protein
MQPHTSFKRYIAALTIGGLIMALLFLTLPSYAAAHFEQATPIATTPPISPTNLPVSQTPTSIAPQPTPSPVAQQPASDSDCPGATLDVTTPSIEFCSPRFKGNAEGPYGTHITLLGRNIPGTPADLYLLQVPKGKSPAPSVHISNNSCASSVQCFHVDNVQPPLSQIQKTQHFKLFFNWTIQGAERGKDYYAVLAYRSGRKQEVPVISPFSFTLLSNNAPCIVVSPDQNITQGCPTSDSTLQLTEGSTVYIHGENWYPGDVFQKIKIELSTCQQLPCQGGRTFQLPDATPDQNGAFTKSVQINLEWNNTYILASNYVPYNMIPTSNIQGQADEALTSGYRDQGDAVALHLNIVRPCIMVTSSNPAHTTLPEQAPSNCTQPSSKPIAVTAGTSLYLQGFYWLTSQEHKVTVQITCTSHSCTGSKLKSPTAPFVIKQSASGYFYLTVPVPADSTGSYKIQVNQETIPYAPSLTIQINKPPVTNTPFSSLPLLALLPAILSLLLYIVTQRRRTALATAPRQSMSGGSTPITLRSSLQPPVTRQRPGGRR